MTIITPERESPAPAGFRASRRDFLKGAAVGIGAALVVGFDGHGALAAGDGAAVLNPFVEIGEDGAVTVILKHFEMGQGTTTGLTTLVAEELDADWETTRFAFAPSDNERYANLAFGAQGTGGSTAIANSYLQYRKAGAAARAVLIEAAAAQWGVSPADVTIENGMLAHGDQRMHFGEVAAAAAELTPPAEPTLKPANALRYIGNARLPRKDSAAKTDGSAQFAMDARVEGMVYATILRSPKAGGTLKSFDAAGAAETPGFVDAKALPNGGGVAIYASNTWAAFSARDLVEAEWDFAQAETRSTAALIEAGRAKLDAPSYTVKGDPTAAARAIEGAATVIEADYEMPMLAHAPMEPLNCLIEPTETGVRVIDGCQFPVITHPTVAAILGLDVSQVEIETVLAGGSFGRRANPTSDYQAEAALAFAAYGAKTPVKLVWSREDDIRGGYYRPLALHRARIGLDAEGRIVGWDHRVACQSIIKGTLFEPMMVHNGVDHTSVEGLADSPYGLPMALSLSDIETPLKALWWRSVGHTHTAFVVETLVDRLAEAAGVDPVAYRLSLLEADGPAETAADHQRLAGVLKLAAEKAGWSTPVGAGRGRGVAVHKSFGSYVAEVVEVSVDGEGAVKVEKVVCAVDCGVAINPDVIAAQMEGGIGYGLGAIMRNAITLTDGEVDQYNFPDYEPLRMSDMPDVEVHIVPSEAAPSGVGEPGVPPVGPALANAIHAAAGQRVTLLPMTEGGVTFA